MKTKNNGQSSNGPDRRQRPVGNNREKQPAIQTDWYDTHDVCQALHISEKTLFRYVNKMKLFPYSKPGGKYYFYWPDIENCLNANRIPKNGMPCPPDPTAPE